MCTDPDESSRHATRRRYKRTLVSRTRKMRNYVLGDLFKHINSLPAEERTRHKLSKPVGGRVALRERVAHREIGSFAAMGSPDEMDEDVILDGDIELDAEASLRLTQEREIAQWAKDNPYAVVNIVR